MTNLLRAAYSTSLLTLVATISLPRQAAAQNGYMFQPPAVTLSLRAGPGGPSAPRNDNVFSILLDTLSLKPGDFRSTSVAFELGVRVSPQAELLFGVAHDESSNHSEYRHWLDERNLPITQTTDLKRTPVTVSVRYYLTPRGRSLARHAWIPANLTPYVVAGGGLMFYDLHQDGEFIDVNSPTFDIIGGPLRSTGSGLMGQVGGGANWWFASHLGLTVDARYAWSTAKLHDDYSAWDRINLRGFQVTTGLAVQF